MSRLVPSSVVTMLRLGMFAAAGAMLFAPASGCTSPQEASGSTDAEESLSGPTQPWTGTFTHAGSIQLGQVTFTSRTDVTVSNGTMFDPGLTCYGEENGVYGYQEWSGGKSNIELHSAELSRLVESDEDPHVRLLPGTYDVILHTYSDCLTVHPALSGIYRVSLAGSEDSSRCGDGQIDRDLNEVCDDGNNVSGDGCESDCTLPVVRCGNFVVDPGEECDGSPGTNPGWVCDDTCHFAEGVDVDPNQAPNFADYAKGTNILMLGAWGASLSYQRDVVMNYRRSARGILAPGDVDRITFSADSVASGSTPGSAVSTFALKGHLELDCSDASVSLTVRAPRAYTPAPGVFTDPSCLHQGSASCQYRDALLDRSPTTPDAVGRGGAALVTTETRYAGDGVCPATDFVLEPLFCVGGHYQMPYCFWPVIDVQAHAGWAGGARTTVPWRYVIDSVEPRTMTVDEVWQ